MFWIAYLLSPRFCHRFVGYLEEEAVKTYTNCLEVYRREVETTMVVLVHLGGSLLPFTDYSTPSDFEEVIVLLKLPLIFAMTMFSGSYPLSSCPIAGH